jgi:Flp pilus assembly protein TadG
MRRQRSQGKQSSRRGAALVETALVLPVFLTVALGIIEYGRALMAANLVTSAAREGARIAARDGSTNTDVQNAVKAFLSSSLHMSPGSVSVTITITPAPGNPNPQNECANAKVKDLIGVDVRVPYSAVAVIPGTFLQNVMLSGRSYMRHE